MIQFRRRRTLAAIALTSLVIATVAATGPSLADATSPEELTELTFASGFGVNASVTPVVVAQERGYFRDEGVDVEFVVPADPTDAMRLVAAGEADIGAVNSLTLLIARPRGIELRSVATTAQTVTNGIMTRPELHFEDLEQLEGLTVGTTGFIGNRVIFEDILRRHDVDIDQIDFVDIGATGPQALAQGTVDALADQTIFNGPIQYNALIGAAPDDTTTYDFMSFADLGAPRYYTPNIATSNTFLADHPDAMSAFLRAWTAAFAWSLEHQDEAAQIVVDTYPELALDIVTAQWKTLAPYTTHPDTDQHGLGWQDPEAWQAQADFLYDHDLIEQPIDTAEVLTNEFLPGG